MMTITSNVTAYFHHLCCPKLIMARGRKLHCLSAEVLPSAQPVIPNYLLRQAKTVVLYVARAQDKNGVSATKKK